MQDRLGNDIQAGDIIVCAAGIYGGINVGRVANLTAKGLAYQPLNAAASKRQYTYEHDGVGLVSAGHRGQTFDECYAAFREHRKRVRQPENVFDTMYNQLTQGAIVAFAEKKAPFKQAHGTMLFLGQLTGLIPGYDMATAAPRPYVQLQLLGSTKLVTRRSQEVVGVRSSYEGLNPALVRELLSNF